MESILHRYQSNGGSLCFGDDVWYISLILWTWSVRESVHTLKYWIMKTVMLDQLRRDSTARGFLESWLRWSGSLGMNSLVGPYFWSTTGRPRRSKGRWLCSLVYNRRQKTLGKEIWRICMLPEDSSSINFWPERNIHIIRSTGSQPLRGDCQPSKLPQIFLKFHFFHLIFAFPLLRAWRVPVT